MTQIREGSLRMSTCRTISVVIKGHPGTGYATLTIPLLDGSGYVSLYGVGMGPHRIDSVENQDGTITLTGKSGKLTTSVTVPSKTALS